VTIVRRAPGGTIDEFGGEIADEVLIETVGELQQRKRDEAQGQLSQTDWLLILPAGTEIDTGDGVLVDGLIFEVTGAPWEARNPRTMVASHIEATLRRVATSDQEGS
jgi:hypothetical protein